MSDSTEQTQATGSKPHPGAEPESASAPPLPPPIFGHRVVPSPHPAEAPASEPIFSEDNDNDFVNNDVEESGLDHGVSSRREAVADGDEAAHIGRKELKAAAKKLRKLPDDELIEIASAAQRAREDAEHFRSLAARAQADFDNYQKRMEKQRREDIRYASQSLVIELLPVLDNLARAVAACPQTAADPAAEAIRKGVTMTLSMLTQTLDKQGLKAVDATGQPFDPEFHEAVLTGSDPDKPGDTVLDCFEKGYVLNDRVIRPAKVRVNKLA
jgi:molecular chaperone GrpE